MNEHSPISEGQLHTLLRSARPAPPLPPRFQEGVWRRLEHRETVALITPCAFDWLERLVERLLRPRLVLASLTFLLSAGALTGALTSAGVIKQQAQARYLAAVAPHQVR